MKIAIIDGNKKNAQLLSKWANNQNNYQVVGNAYCLLSAMELIQKQKPDLIVLNTQLKNASGFDVLELIPNKSTQVILIGSEESEIDNALAFNVFDFMVTPINWYSIQHSINRFKRNQYINESKGTYEQIKPKVKKNSKIGIPSSTGTQYVSIDNIIYLKAESNYSNIYLEGGKSVLVSKILRLFENKLQRSSFVRVHRSYIVNLEKVVERCNGDGGYLVLKNKVKIPVSRNKKKFVMHQLNRHFNSI